MTRSDRLRSIASAIELQTGGRTGAVLRLFACLLEQEPTAAVAPGALEYAIALERDAALAERVIETMTATRMAELASVARMWREAAGVLRELRSADVPS